MHKTRRKMVPWSCRIRVWGFSGVTSNTCLRCLETRFSTPSLASLSASPVESPGFLALPKQVFAEGKGTVFCTTSKGTIFRRVLYPPEKVRMVMDHFGCALGPATDLNAWKKAVQEVADSCPNVVAKVGGISGGGGLALKFEGFKKACISKK